MATSPPVDDRVSEVSTSIQGLLQPQKTFFRSRAIAETPWKMAQSKRQARLGQAVQGQEVLQSSGLSRSHTNIVGQSISRQQTQRKRPESLSDSSATTHFEHGVNPFLVKSMPQQPVHATHQNSVNADHRFGSPNHGEPTTHDPPKESPLITKAGFHPTKLYLRTPDRLTGPPRSRPVSCINSSSLKPCTGRAMMKYMHRGLTWTPKHRPKKASAKVALKVQADYPKTHNEKLSAERKHSQLISELANGETEIKLLIAKLNVAQGMANNERALANHHKMLLDREVNKVNIMQAERNNERALAVHFHMLLDRQIANTASVELTSSSNSGLPVPVQPQTQTAEALQREYLQQSNDVGSNTLEEHFQGFETTNKFGLKPHNNGPGPIWRSMPFAEIVITNEDQEAKDSVRIIPSWGNEIQALDLLPRSPFPKIIGGACSHTGLQQKHCGVAQIHSNEEHDHKYSTASQNTGEILRSHSTRITHLKSSLKAADCVREAEVTEDLIAVAPQIKRLTNHVLGLGKLESNQSQNTSSNLARGAVINNSPDSCYDEVRPYEISELLSLREGFNDMLTGSERQLRENAFPTGLGISSRQVPEDNLNIATMTSPPSHPKPAEWRWSVIPDLSLMDPRVSSQYPPNTRTVPVSEVLDSVLGITRFHNDMSVSNAKDGIGIDLINCSR